MIALLNPINRTGGGIKWGLVIHTVTMFSALTLNAAMNLKLSSITYIENRESPDTNSSPPPGSPGYQFFAESMEITDVVTVVFNLNSCLADGFLASPFPN